MKNDILSKYFIIQDSFIKNIEEINNFDRVSYIVYIRGHKNSKGEPAPWVIKSHKTHKIISSHKTRKEAEKHLRQIQYFKHKK
jgi:hypothetical protein